ncbi:MAG: HU family DNA-binding protein [Planctomycetes bacterium]|nr:HU family DNA-binding protein [Planctomycetota bacterium]
MNTRYSGFTRRRGKVNKNDIIEALATETGLSRRKAAEAVSRTLEIIMEEVKKTGRIEFRGFGVFETKLRAARTARNPRTNEQMVIEPRKVLSFIPGNQLRKLVQETLDQGKEGEAEGSLKK